MTLLSRPAEGTTIFKSVQALREAIQTGENVGCNTEKWFFNNWKEIHGLESSKTGKERKP